MMKINKFFYALVIVAGSISLPVFAASEDGSSNQTDIPRQSTSPDRVVRRLIVEGSVVNAGYEGGDSSRYTQPNGYAAGILFDLFGHAKTVLETGALYRQLGTTVSDSFGNNTLTANYISVPVALKYYFNGQENSSLYLKVGVMGSALISNNYIYESSTTQIGAQTWETAVLGGLGLKVNLSSNSDLLIEADYNRSLNSVFANSSVYRSDLAGTLGVAFNL